MAFTVPIDSAVTGEVAPASLWNTFVRDNMMSTMHLLARKSADQTVNNSSTLVNDTHLKYAAEANEVWLIHALLIIDGGSATPDIKFKWTLPASGTMRWAWDSSDAATNNTWGMRDTTTSPSALNDEGVGANSGTAAGGIIYGLAITGIAVIAGTAGDIQLQWAQVTPTAVNTTVKQNSCLMGARLSP
jgi:hypothetical protein